MTRLLLGLLVLVAMPRMALAQFSPDTVVEPSSGVLFPVSLTPPGGTTPHWIMGTAIRQRTIFKLKIYAFGLYVDTTAARLTLTSFQDLSASLLRRDERFYERLLELEFAMTLRLVMTRTVDGGDVADAFDDALRPRLVRAATSATAPDEVAVLEMFGGYFDVDQVRSGTELVFSCDSEGRLTTSFGGADRPAIDSRLLCRALFDVYLGEDPVSEAGKQALTAGFPGLLTPVPGQ